MKKTRWIVKLRVILWLILVIILVWIFFKAIVPSGNISYTYDFIKPSRFIGKLTPAERVDEIQGGEQRIIGDPVYFSLRLPRGFDKAKLSVKYKNDNDHLPIMEAGVLVDKQVWNYALEPIENKIIDQLAMVWDVIEEDGSMFLQKEKKYNSIDEFLNNFLDKNEIALYNYDAKELAREYVIEDYQPGGEIQEINLALRGDYEFYTYINNEELNFNFRVMDLNENLASDPIDLNLYYADQLIASEHLPDDGNAQDNGEESEAREIGLKLINLPTGVYKISLRTNNDIITKSITTSQSKISFINKLWVDDSQDNITLYTDSQAINAQTINPGSLQTIEIGEDKLGIEETYRQFSLKAPLGIKEIKIGQGDVILSGNGVFSFNENSLINPQFRKVDNSLDINESGINYILARYIRPKINGEWKEAQAEFNIKDAYWEWSKTSFILSVPGLKADDAIEDSWEINNIKVELVGKTLLEKVKEFFIR